RCFLSALARRFRRLYDLFALLLRQQCQLLSASHVLPRLIPHEIRRHRKQPGSLVLYRSLPQGTHDRLLRNSLGPVAISQPPRQISHQRGVVSSEESLYVGHSVTNDPVST